MMRGRRFSLNWKIALFTAVFLPLMVHLGFWQLDREQEKRVLQAAWESRLGEIPVSLDEAAAMDDPAWVAVGLEGQYDVLRSFLLDNTIWQGRAGYEVITPLTTSGGRTVLINRGWVPQGATRQSLPELAPVPGHHTLIANIHVPAGDPVMLGSESAFDGWPRVLQKIDAARMYDELGIDDRQRGLDHVLRLQDGMPGALVRHWEPVNTLPQKHRAYAVQWFAMATALLLLFIYSCFPKRGGGTAPNGNRQ